MSSSVSKWIVRYRAFVISPPLIFSLLWSRGISKADYVIWPVGVFICLMGVAVRVWAEQHINRKETTRERHLANSGPYKYVRNPLYIGNILLCVGATVLSEVLWMVPVTFIWCLAIFNLVVKREESVLVKDYGEPYRKFLSEIPRWFPNTINFNNFEFTNSYFKKALMGEVQCMFIIVPYLIKELILK